MNNSNQSDFSKESKEIAIKLHSELSIKNNEWHKLRGNNKKRSAELISAALIQLLNKGDIDDTKNKIEHALKWLKNEIKDPGCSSH